MKKKEFEDFIIKIKGFEKTSINRLDSDKYAILINENIVQIFEKTPLNIEDFIIRKQPPKLVDTYSLEYVELKDGKIKKKENENGT
ncbi:hypothetical protein ES702_05882 [subsurface metagenome]